MESLSGKEDLFEVEAGAGNQFEKKSSSTTLKLKLSDLGWDFVAIAPQVFDFSNSFLSAEESPLRHAQVSSDLKLYLLYCQLKRHC